MAPSADASTRNLTLREVAKAHRPALVAAIADFRVVRTLAEAIKRGVNGCGARPGAGDGPCSQKLRF